MWHFSTPQVSVEQEAAKLLINQEVSVTTAVHRCLGHQCGGQRVVVLKANFDVRVINEGGKAIRHWTLDPPANLKPPQQKVF